MGVDRKYRLRFNLGRGENYMKWAINGKSENSYVDPEEYNIVMTNCKLHNRKKTAQKICEGAHKTVCAWIQAEQIKLREPFVTTIIPEGSVELLYNPRTAPHWRKKGSDSDIDNKTFYKIFTIGTKIYGFGEDYHPPVGEVLS